jgi:hypothetical protein
LTGRSVSANWVCRLGRLPAQPAFMQNRPLREHRIRGAQRRSAILLALIYLAGYLGSALHEAVVRHAVCEHGELVDVHTSHEIGHAATHAVTSGDVRPAIEGQPDDQDEGRHLHDHCVNVVPLAGPARDVPVVMTIAPAIALATSGRTEPIIQRLNFPLYLLAPHHSPPAA